MDFAQWLQPHPAGLVLAAAAVIGGAPLFSSGLRALRLRRQLRRLPAQPGGEAPDGDFAHLSGRVALESPLFGPLSGLPCAGYDLEVRGVATPIRHTLGERRPFRLVDEDGPAEVATSPGHWDVGITAERVLAADDGIGAGLATLLARAPEALWWRRAGGRLHLVERALPAGATAHVVGRVHLTRSIPVPMEEARLRTGTDDLPVAMDPLDAVLPVTTRSVGSGDHLDWLLVSDRPPLPERLSFPLWRSAGVLLGPLLSLLGMLYLASAADHFRGLSF